MLHIIANPFTLTEFLLDSLPVDQRARVQIHPKRIKGVAYSLLKAADAWLPFRLPGFRPFPQPYLEALQAIPEDAAVLIFGIENIKDLRILRKYLRTRRVAVFTWNPVIDYQQNHRVRQVHIRQLKGLGFRVFTFDPEDARQYDLTLTQQVYRQVDAHRRDAPADWDIYFLGQDKNRFDTLRALGEQWQAAGLRTRLQMVPEPGRSYPATPAVELLARSIDYEANIDAINRSRCLLEITQANQNGLTVRCLEALFFGKKLITSNPAVRGLPWYDPGRFFIVGQDDARGVGAFLDAPLPELPRDLLLPHDFAHWVRQFESLSAAGRAA
ncbi:hypothetical protein [Acidovorax sp. BL-A-41-H1]|uniref:hypothetical protein n=1 Tax=Acidovorax sp. BL-A-41-H1 TaxID=3421102 RepID=UPI003F7AA413